MMHFGVSLFLLCVDVVPKTTSQGQQHWLVTFPDADPPVEDFLMNAIEVHEALHLHSYWIQQSAKASMKRTQGENDEKQEDGSEVISNIVVQDEIDEMNERATV